MEQAAMGLTVLGSPPMIGRRRGNGALDVARARVVLGAAVLALLSPACGAREAPSLGAVEAAYLETRGLKDRIDVTRSRGAQSTPEGTKLSELVSRYGAARRRL